MSATKHSIAPYLLRPAATKAAANESSPWVDGGLLRELCGVFGRRWKIIAATVTVLVAGAMGYCLLAEPLYTARATVLIEARGPRVVSDRFGEVEEPFGSKQYDYYQTQFHLLRSPAVAKRVVEELRLTQDPRFVPVEAGTIGAGAALGRYMSQLEVAPVRATRLVHVAFTSSEPSLAADAANAHARIFVSTGLERLYESMGQIRGFLQTKLDELQENMHRAETTLLDFQSANHLLPVSLRNDVASERLMDLSRRLTQAEADRIMLEAEYQLVTRGEFENLPGVINDSNIQRLRQDYHRLQLEQTLLAAKWRPTYPALRQLSSQVEQARELLEKAFVTAGETTKARYLGAKSTADRLSEELELQRSALLDRKDAEGELLTLTREAETTRALYDNLLARVKELDVAGGAQISNISLAEAAVVPHSPSSPNVPFSVLLSLLTGLMLGTGLAFLREASDQTIRDTDDIQRATGLGTLAVIPEFAPDADDAHQGTVTAGSLIRQSNSLLGPGGRGELAAPRLVLGNGHVESSAEAYRTLRTSLLLNQGPTPPRVIVVASASGTEGKTTTAVNTAASLASCGASVLLVDGDLRLPRCHEALGLALEPGLSSYLAGQVMSQPIQATKVKNLSFIAAGRSVQNPTELLTSWRMWQLLTGARDHFDFVVIDSPPLLPVSDGLLLANVADGVLLVVESKRSREQQVHEAMQRLQQTGACVLGAVLNRGTVEHGYDEYAWSGENTAPDAPINVEDDERSAADAS
jgi:succinoglycan biosynthesis transport protein ExoP